MGCGTSLPAADAKPAASAGPGAGLHIVPGAASIHTPVRAVIETSSFIEDVTMLVSVQNWLQSIDMEAEYWCALQACSTAQVPFVGGGGRAG